MTKIEMTGDTKRELIMRVLLSNDILGGMENKQKELTIGIDDLIDRVYKIEQMIFDENFENKMKEVLGDE